MNRIRKLSNTSGDENPIEILSQVEPQETFFEAQFAVVKDLRDAERIKELLWSPSDWISDIQSGLQLTKKNINHIVNRLADFKGISETLTYGKQGKNKSSENMKPKK